MNLPYPIDFSGADLSGANFAEAMCNSGLFRRCARTDAATTCPAGHKGPCLDFATVVAHRNRDILNRSELCPSWDLRGINLDDKGGARVILDRADLSYASLYHFDAPHGSFVQATFLGADLVGNFTRATFQGADLRALRLGGTFVDAQMNSADLSGTQAQLANFQGTVLINARLVRTNLRGVDLRGANLRGADVTEATYLERTKTDATTTCPERGACW